ncbi:MAG TPA: hypothetical protein VHG28_09980 [Longimicrobiaceae bacterium]|nr:hypothetical protein [Longimicrobiaceae bacterium]
MTDPNPSPDPGTAAGTSSPLAKRLAGKARFTPYEFVFGEAGFELRTFPRIQAEAEQQGIDATHPDRFAFLTIGAEAIREVVPEDVPPETLEEYRLFLYHAYNFWCYGRRLYVLDPAATRFLVESTPDLRRWEMRLPAQSVYVQLPPNLFWASVSPEVPPEPVDGFFVCCHEAMDGRGDTFETLEVLMVLGIRRERAGFSLIHFGAEVVPGIAAAWSDTPARDEGRDFESILPGGEMAGLYSILTIPEALKLISRILWYIDRHPGQVTAHAAPERRTTDRPGSVPLSHLPFHCVSLHESDAGAAAEAAGDG